MSLPTWIDVAPTTDGVDHALDRLQALHTVLCYLCAINAHHRDVALFLRHHPQALLLEGVNDEPQESALHILSEQMEECACRSTACNQNRCMIVETMQQQGYRLDATGTHRDTDIFGIWLVNLQESEKEVRKLRLEQRMLQYRLADAKGDVAHFELKLKELHQVVRGVARLTCGAGKHADRAVMEYQASVANLRVASLEREHRQILREIRECRRRQFLVLKQSNPLIHRHYCTANQRPGKQAV